MYFAETNNGSGAGNRLYRATFAGASLVQVRGASTINSVAWTGDRHVVSRGQEGCSAEFPSGSLEILDPPDFAPARRGR